MQGVQSIIQADFVTSGQDGGEPRVTRVFGPGYLAHSAELKVQTPWLWDKVCGIQAWAGVGLGNVCSLDAFSEAG